MNRPLDLAQPFVAPDIHPHWCDCADCTFDADHAARADFGRELAWFVMIALGGLILGPVVGEALRAAGVLALLGIG